MTRTLAVLCGDWPVRAHGVAAGVPVAVFEANRVVSVTPGGRAAGVQVGLRRREAQARCPEVEVLERDLTREARLFEPVLSALNRFSPLVEVSRPGLAALASRGPARYFGGELALADAIGAAVDEALGAQGGCAVGLADGFFAARWAAEAAGSAGSSCEATADGGWGGPYRPVVVERGASPEFLSGLALDCLESPGLVEVLWQLGLRTLGEFAELPLGDVVARFGAEGQRCHLLASGREQRPLDAVKPPVDLQVRMDFDPPLERIDQAAFAAKALADRLHHELERRGLACSRVAIEAETEHGESFSRLWRHEGLLSASALADRVRWQLGGWLGSLDGNRPTGGLSHLALVPDEVGVAHGRQLGFWGGQNREVERAVQAGARVATLLGPEAVAVPERRGGRHADEQFERVPLGAVDLVARAEAAADVVGAAIASKRVGGPGPTRGAAGRGRAPGPKGSSRQRDPADAGSEPWPGVLPVPPAVVHSPPVPARVLDEDGSELEVNGRGLLSASPAQVSLGTGGPWQAVVAWAGPWPVEERWWDPTQRRRRARFQVVLADGVAHLVHLEGGCWWWSATFG
ncbi:MAG: DNA polymerase Y family protein [Acidimicrobiia bacterium]|nr:DNA polymerase Y family protein [Acidimicrobiia bacterium]